VGEKYAEPWGRRDEVTSSRIPLEKPHGEDLRDLSIRTTPERLWEAITDPQIRAKYNCVAGVSAD